MSTIDDVLIVGAGVIGLTTAVSLAEAGVGVRIWTRERPEDTTSAVAGAIWGRGPGVQEPRERIAAWSGATVGVLNELAERPGTGVRVAEGLEATREPGASAGAADGAPGARDDLPPGYVDR
ncbi:FAD-dependent oxidoreductase [Nocardia pseudobrasiliensis]|uniref:D-amino-acid oxidase n=1 Tax=Nocardia pseudobrasiliensis TaxID=45979 RepID=A0A370HYA9_9NOCA|nr:FAD-dependent oxidoreductase [Nocardia pseudobrasiliensis]RDI63478.1 FAD dependent oxidoreductase [Nocardia pseudobrasiliensis]